MDIEDAEALLKIGALAEYRYSEESLERFSRDPTDFEQ